MNTRREGSAGSGSSHGFPAYRPKPVTRAIRLALWTALGVLTAVPAQANPAGPQVVRGQVGFSQPAPGTLNITNSPGAIINWQSFSIGARETTRFIQQNAASTVLNRVTGRDPSAILGQLLSNGRVFLINPAGIVFGPTAVVDTAGLIASSLNMTDADFIAGRFRFQGGPEAGSIRNEGLIRAGKNGEIVLIAPAVENSGIIQAPDGKILLAAGEKVTLTSLDADGISFEVQAPADTVVNLGQIIADRGTVGAFAGTIRNRGLIQADSVRVDATGRVVLSATGDIDLAAGSRVSASGAGGGSVTVASASGTTTVAGVVAASGDAGAGGEIQLLGERVGLMNGAAVDASGGAGGGRVLVGGDRQGKNPAVRNAKQTHVAPETSIKADATARGDGGTVIVWADETARVHGTLSARGGPDGGDGGFVETSGKRFLEVTRGPDLRAPLGQPGTWLLDPRNIEIVAGSALSNNLDAPFFTPVGDTSIIGADLINAQLDLGSNVTITTQDEQGVAPGAQAGNIVVNAALTKTVSGEGFGTTSLTLLAHNDIVLNAPISSTGAPLNVMLRADHGTDGFLADGLGGITSNATINTNGGSVILSAGGPVNLGAAITTAGGSFQAGNGSVPLGGGFSLNAVLDTRSGGGFAGSVQVHTLGSLTLASGAAIQAGNSSVTLNSLSPATVTVTTGAGVTGGFLTVTSDVVVVDGALSGSTVNLNAIDLSIAGTVSASSSATVSADNLALGGTLGAGAGAVRVQPRTVSRPMNVGTKVAGSLGLTAAELGRITAGTLTLGSSSTGLMSFSASASPTSFTNLVLQTGPGITVNSGVNLSLPGALTFSGFAVGSSHTLDGAVTASGAISGSAASAISVAAGLTSSGAGITLNAPSLTSSAPVVAAGGISLIADAFNIGAAVRSTGGGNIDVRRRAFGSLVVGAASPGAGLESAEIDRFETTGALRVGDTSFTSAVTVSGPIAPVGVSTLSLLASGNITQSLEPAAIITVDNLRAFSSSGSVTLGAANVVNTLAGNAGSFGSFAFTRAAGGSLAVGVVDGTTGVRGGTVALTADGLAVGSNVVATSSSAPRIDLKPVTGTRGLLLGGTTEDETRLHLTRAELLLLFGGFNGAVRLSGDDIDVLDPGGGLKLQAGSGALTLAPYTAGTDVVLGIDDEGGMVGLSPAEVALLSGPVVIRTDGAGSIMTGADVSFSGSSLSLISGADIAIGHSLSTGNAPFTADAAGGLGILGSPADLDGRVSTGFGSVTLIARSGAADAIRVENGGVRIVSTGSLLMQADRMQLDGGIQASSATLQRNTGGLVTVGGGSAGLGLSDTELDNIVATTLTIDALGGTLTADGELTRTGNLILRAGGIDVPGSGTPVIATGTVELIANTMALGDAVQSSGGGRITLRPLSAGFGIDLGTETAGKLSITDAELGQLLTSTVVQIGDPNNTGSISVSAPVSYEGNLTLLAAGDITATGSGRIHTFALRASSTWGGVQLSGDNEVETLAGSGYYWEAFQFTNGETELHIGTVDGQAGISAYQVELTAHELNVGATVTGNESVVLTAEYLAVNADVRGWGEGGVTIRPRFDGTVLELGVGGEELALTQAELNRIFGSLTLQSDAIDVLSPVSYAGGALILTPLSESTGIVLGDFDGDDYIGLTGEELAGLSGGTLRLLADAFIETAAAVDVSGFDTLILEADEVFVDHELTFGSRLQVVAEVIEIAADVVGTGSVVQLDPRGCCLDFGLDAALVGHVKASQLEIGSYYGHHRWGTVNVADAINASTIGDSPVADLAIRAETINVGSMASVDVAGDVSLEADVEVNQAGLVRGGGFVSVSGGDVNINGTLAGAQGVHVYAWDDLNAGGSSTISSSGGDVNLQADDAVNLAGPVTSTLGDVYVSGSALNLSALIQAGRDVHLRGDTMNVSATVQAARHINVAPWNWRSISLGTGVDGLVLTAAELNRFVAGGTLRIGETYGNTNSITVRSAIAPTGASTLSLNAYYDITQLDGAPITVANLMAASEWGSVSLLAPNNVSVLAGRSAGNFEFASAAGRLLTVGTVDGQAGVDGTGGYYWWGGYVDLYADDFNILAPIRSNEEVVLGVVSPSRAVTIGGSVAGTMSLSAAELDLIFAESLFIERQSSGEVLGAGTITVAGATSPANVNSLGFASSGNTIHVNAPLTVREDLYLVSDVININQPIQAGYAVYLAPMTDGRPLRVGTKTADALSFTVEEIDRITAEFLALGVPSYFLDEDFGVMAGPIHIGAPLAPAGVRSLALYSGGGITQAPGAVIDVDELYLEAGGTIDLREANLVRSYLWGYVTEGIRADFLFNNVLPLKLQNVSVSNWSGGPGRPDLGLLRVTTGSEEQPPPPPPPPPEEEPDPEIVQKLVDAILALQGGKELAEEDEEEDSEKDATEVLAEADDEGEDEKPGECR